MSRLARENIAAIAILVVFGGVVWLCQDFGPRARLIPLPLAIAGIVLTLIQIVWQNLRSTDELQMDLISAPEPAPAAAESAPEVSAPAADTGSRAPWAREARAYAMVGILLGLILVVGLLPAVFVFTAGYFVVTRQYSWVVALAWTAAFTAVVYVLFFVALQIQPYHGLLTPLVEQWR